MLVLSAEHCQHGAAVGLHVDDQVAVAMEARFLANYVVEVLEVLVTEPHKEKMIERCTRAGRH